MKTKWLIGIITVLLFGVMTLTLFAPASGAQAARNDQLSAGPTPAPLRETLIPVRETLSDLPTPDNTLLENMLSREKLALGNQKTRLELSHTVAATVQSYIDKQKSAGKDTSALESALAGFNQAIKDAETANAAAAGLLAAPAGFDANGKVTDRETARQTLRAAGRSLRQARRIIKPGTLALRQAVKTYRNQ